MSSRTPVKAFAGLVLVLGILVAAPATGAAADRTRPSAPSARAVDVAKTSVSLSWTRATDNSGSLKYVVNLWQDPTTVTLSQSQTSYTWTGLRPNVQYFFWVEAVDPSGNKATSNQVTVTTLRDNTPPPAPANLRVSNVGSSQASSSWEASPDDTGIAEYHVLVNGSRWGILTPTTSRSGLRTSATTSRRPARSKARRRARARTPGRRPRRPTSSCGTSTAARC